MKKLYSVVLLSAMLFAVTFAAFKPMRNAVFVSAAEVEHADLKVDAKAAYLVDYNTGTVLYSLNPESRYPIASMCKIMTLLLTFEHVDSGAMKYDDKIVISDEAAHMGGSQAFLDAGSEYAVTDLLKTVVIASANDSSVALAETVCGSQSLFVEKMNERAKALGMNNTNFVNCTGLPAPGQYCCAKDVSLMTRELLKHKKYYEYTGIWMDDFKHPSGRVTGLTNTNKLIRFYKGCDSGKTGYTSEAGHCLSASAIRDNMRLVSTIIGAPNSKSRFRDISGMFNYGFSTFCNRQVISPDKPLEQKTAVSGGKVKEIAVKPAEGYYQFCKKSEKPAAPELRVELPMCKAPIAVGDKVGTLYVAQDGVVVKEIDLVAAEAAEKASFMDLLENILRKWGLLGK